MMWNANNTYGFESIDWGALQRAATVTTVSRYMKFELHARGIQSLVVPNGIPDRILGGPPDDLVRATAAALRRRPLFVKVGRFDEDKRWIQAIEALRRFAPRIRPRSSSFAADAKPTAQRFSRATTWTHG